MLSSTRLSKAQNSSVITPQKMSFPSVVNSTPVKSSIILKTKSIEPTQSPIEKPFNHSSVLTRSQKRINAISGQDLSYCKASSFESTPKCSKSKPSSLSKFSAPEKHTDRDATNGVLANKCVRKKTGISVPTGNLHKIIRSKSDLSPHTKIQNRQISRLSCFSKHVIGWNDSDISNEKIMSKRLTRSITRLHSDLETSINHAPLVLKNDNSNGKYKTSKECSQNIKSHSVAAQVVGTGKPDGAKKTVITKSNDSVMKSKKILLPKMDTDISLQNQIKVAPSASDSQNTGIITAKDNNTLNCSKNDSSGQNDNASESCDSLSKRNSHKFSSRSPSKPSFIRRKLYSQQSDFSGSDIVKTVDASFLEKNDFKNVYVIKKKSLNSQNRQSSSNNIVGSDRSTHSEPVRKSINTLRTYCLRKNQKDSYSADIDNGVNSDSAVNNRKENTCQFIAGLLKDIDPKNVPQVISNNIQIDDAINRDTPLETVKDSDENFDLFSANIKRPKARNQKSIKKPLVKTKVKPKQIYKGNIEKIGEAKEKEFRCISSSESDTEDELSYAASDEKIKRKEKFKKAPVKTSHLASTKKINNVTKAKTVKKLRHSSPSDGDHSDRSPVREDKKNRYSKEYATKRSKTNQEPRKLPVRHSKLVTTKKIKNVTKEIAVEKIKHSSLCGSNYSSGEHFNRLSVHADKKNSHSRECATKVFQKVPASHSKMVANKNIKNFAKERSLQNNEHASKSGSDNSFEEYSDESPYKRYSEEYISEEYDSPVHVMKNKTANILICPKNPSCKPFKMVPSNEIQKHAPNPRLPSRKYCRTTGSYRSVDEDLNDLPVKKYTNIEYSHSLKTVPKNTFKMGNFVSSNYDSMKETSESNKIKDNIGHFQTDFSLQRNFIDSDKKLSVNCQCISHEYKTGNLDNNLYSDISDRMNGHRLIEVSKHVYNKGSNEIACNKKSSGIESFKRLPEMISWNKNVQHFKSFHMKSEEFKLPMHMFNSKPLKECQKSEDNKFESNMRTAQNNWNGEINTSMLRGAQSGRLQNRNLNSMKLNFNSENKPFSQSVLGSTFVGWDSESYSNKTKIRPEISFMSHNQNISYFNKTSTQLAKDTRHLVHSQTMCQNYPNMPLGKAALSGNYAFGNKSYLRADFSDLYNISGYNSKKYNHRECVKMNIFDNQDSRKNDQDNSLYPRDHGRGQFTRDKVEKKSVSTITNQSHSYVPSYRESLVSHDSMTVGNQSKYVNYKSLFAMGHPDISYNENQIYQRADLFKCKTFSAIEQVNKPPKDVVDIDDIDAAFKVPREPTKKRKIADVGEEQYGVPSKIPKCIDSWPSSFSTSNITYASLKGKENFLEDKTSVITGKSNSRKLCLFQKKSILSRSIVNGTLLGNTASKMGASTSDLLSMSNNRFASKQVLPEKSFSSSTDKMPGFVKSSNVNNGNYMESSEVFQNSYLTNKHVSTMKDESIFSKCRLLSQKSDMSFIVRCKSDYSIRSNTGSFKELDLKSARPSKPAESAHSSKELQSEQFTPKKLHTKETDIISRSVNHSPWRFVVLK